ncbi:hypothetical protein HELRODRAFT_182798 [Helobdella robusta]|uniref:Uncharacterized protein n=1 Tax=Helobdella robusta TaxID=6412 RepID=T1FIR6_HELRO|nr:hypothetical protein HELRODRAFT_182798 [Helobdella robusta]ESN90104.1 hypothetical protein HELRODRAFT_182798 [Helobdella robusta]
MDDFDCEARDVCDARVSSDARVQPKDVNDESYNKHQRYPFDHSTPRKLNKKTALLQVLTKSRKDHDICLWLKIPKQQKRGVTRKEITQVSRAKTWPGGTTYGADKGDALQNSHGIVEIGTNGSILTGARQLDHNFYGVRKARLLRNCLAACSLRAFPQTRPRMTTACNG